MDFIQKLKTVVADSSLRKRLFFIGAMLIAFRFLSAIPIPGVDILKLEEERVRLTEFRKEQGDLKSIQDGDLIAIQN